MIAQGIHNQAPHMQLIWLAQRLQSRAQDILNDSSLAVSMAPTVISSVLPGVASSAIVHGPSNTSDSSIRPKSLAVLPALPHSTTARAAESTVPVATISYSECHPDNSSHVYLEMQSVARDIAPHIPCECTCDNFLPPGMRSGDASIAAGCIGLCGVAHVSHDMWALGVILYRLCARRSLW